ncbi:MULTISPECIES: DUF3153 domain-containing protein [unclassified Nodularia (in: cyanobacteria)]|uniref:DUF3153 domain-containing protein n=1 Tax=unclassified Nodularia (in: cyanobacteria) TaxID=2656917 RepID=UPI00187EF89D|nr:MULTISPECIES: DUF3153 domain-containing protein [unclassified Nodularia (in: cyanobacteria)]MBE9200286.1 DUF3153 domain-containing protein [Nodularia sp. LEGE 06071]MCC2695865.1 DUF3153 domain-containing protein [Nodularia sp. LEGE 04288]
MNYSIFRKILVRFTKALSFVLIKMASFIKQLSQNLIHRIFPLKNPILWLVLLSSLLLTGCVEYDAGVTFNNSNRGEIVQHIKLGERLTSFSGDYVYEWLHSIERRTRQLEGTTQRISPEEIIVKIPFSNGQELQEKFNNFLNSRTNQKADAVQKASESELPKIESNLLINQNNFVLLVRNRLIYDLDLRSLSLIASRGNVLSDTGSILDLEFSLKTPWGARNIQQNETAINPQKQGKQLVWQLQPGQLNHIEVVFWLPSPLGIGGLLIILFIWGGIYLRYHFMPDPRVQFAPDAKAATE